MTLQEYQGLAGPRTLHLNSHGALPPLSSPGRCGTRCEALGSQAVCKQASPASLRDAHAGPGGGSQARLRPGQTPLHTPGRAGIQAPRGLPGRAGPSRSPRASGLPRDAGKEGPKHQSNAVDTAAAAAAGRAVRPARGQPPGPPGCGGRGRPREGVAPHSPRAAAAAASAWPAAGGVVLEPKAFSSSSGGHQRGPRIRREALQS